MPTEIYLVNETAEPEYETILPEEKTDKDSSDDVYEESAGYVYNEGESPTDDAIPIGDKFTVQIR